MQCPLCGHSKAYKHGKIASGKQGYHCAVCNRTFTETSDTLYYRRQTPPEGIRQVLQAHEKAVASEALPASLDLPITPLLRLSVRPANALNNSIMGMF